MHLCLINPKATFISTNHQIEGILRNSNAAALVDSLYTCPNLGLLTIAALASPHFSKITFIDENFDNIDFEYTYDLVGISAFTCQANRAYTIADLFRNKRIPVIIGGIHASLIPEEVIKHADSVFIGEAECVWDKFIDDFQRKSLQRFYSNKSYPDIDNSPLPKYNLIDRSRYSVIPVQTSRGCPHDCEFCCSSTIFGNKYRFKKISTIVQHVEMITNLWQKPKFYFSDDNMTANKKHTIDLLQSITPYKIRWEGFSDIGIANDGALLELLYKSGCANLLIGFESIDGKNLISIEPWKNKHLHTYADSIHAIQSHGIGVFASFIIGLDNDTKDSIKLLRDFVLKNNIFACLFTIQTPFPRTRLFQRLDKDNRLLGKSWEHHTLFETVFQPLHFEGSELEEHLAWLYKETYSESAMRTRFLHFKELMLKLQHRAVLP